MNVADSETILGVLGGLAAGFDHLGAAAGARRGVLGGTLFGLEPFETTSVEEASHRARTGEAKPRFYAERFQPPLPTVVPIGTGWAGTFAGRGVLPARTPVRVVLGRFVISGTPPRGLAEGFICVSNRYVRLR
jgi:hypothetical protein